MRARAVTVVESVVDSESTPGVTDELTSFYTPLLKVLALGAYPYDVEILCASTHAASGHECFVRIATNGDIEPQDTSRDEMREIRPNHRAAPPGPKSPATI